MTGDLHLLTASDFTPFLQQQWLIRFSDDVKMPAELIDVRESENHFQADRTPFAIVLRTAQKDRYYLQGIYTVEHPEKGDLTLFLVPLGPDARGMLYEAVFT